MQTLEAQKPYNHSHCQHRKQRLRRVHFKMYCVYISRSSVQTSRHILKLIVCILRPSDGR